MQYLLHVWLQPKAPELQKHNKGCCVYSTTCQSCRQLYLGGRRVCPSPSSQDTAEVPPPGAGPAQSHSARMMYNAHSQAPPQLQQRAGEEPGNKATLPEYRSILISEVEIRISC